MKQGRWEEDLRCRRRIGGRKDHVESKDATFERAILDKYDAVPEMCVVIVELNVNSCGAVGGQTQLGILEGDVSLGKFQLELLLGWHPEEGALQLSKRFFRFNVGYLRVELA